MPLFSPLAYQKQPLKTLYLVYAFTSTLAIRLPCWMITSLPGLRPRKSWSFYKSVRLKLLTFMATKVSRVGTIGNPKIINHTAIPPDVDPKVVAVWIEGLKESLVQGEVKELAKVADVKPIRIPGYWYHKEGSPIIGGTRSIDPKEKVIYMFHGGAYLALSANPKDDTQRITRDCLRVLPSELRIRRALSLEYRLSIGVPMVEVPQNPFPAALIDALAGYRYLVEDVGVLPSNIILVGDSAGANLALALTRYLKETGIFQIPGGMILLSPWVDLGNSHVGPTSSRTTNVSSDYLGPPDHLDPSLLYATGAFAGPHPLSVLEENIYISPASKNIPERVLREAFVGYPRTLVVSGSGEQLLDSIETLAERMEKDMGPEKLRYLAIEDAFHDFMAVPWTGPDRLVCLEKIQEWGKGL